MDKFGKKPLQKKGKGKDVSQLVYEQGGITVPQKSILERLSDKLMGRKGSVERISELIEGAKKEQERIAKELADAKNEYQANLDQIADLLTITLYSPSGGEQRLSAMRDSRQSVGSVVAEAAIDEVFGREVRNILINHSKPPVITYHDLKVKSVRDPKYKDLMDALEGADDGPSLDTALVNIYGSLEAPTASSIKELIKGMFQVLRPALPPGKGIDYISCDFSGDVNFIYLYALKVNIDYLQYVVIPRADKYIKRLRDIIELFKKSSSLVSIVKQRDPSFDVKLLQQDETKARDRIEKNINPLIRRLTIIRPTIYRIIKDRMCLLLKGVQKLCSDKSADPESCCKIIKFALDISDEELSDISKFCVPQLEQIDRLALNSSVLRDIMRNYNIAEGDRKDLMAKEKNLSEAAINREINDYLRNLEDTLSDSEKKIYQEDLANRAALRKSMYSVAIVPSEPENDVTKLSDKDIDGFLAAADEMEQYLADLELETGLSGLQS